MSVSKKDEHLPRQKNTYKLVMMPLIDSFKRLKNLMVLKHTMSLQEVPTIMHLLSLVVLLAMLIHYIQIDSLTMLLLLGQN